MTDSSYARLPRYHSLTISLIRVLPVGVGVYFIRLSNFFLRRKPEYLVRTRDGFSLICSARDLVQVCILQFGHWEPNIVAVMKRLVRPGSLAIDIGANVGYDTLILAKLVSEAGAVVAFEASSNTMVALRRNINLNSLSNVRVEQIAISNRKEEVTLFAPDATNSGNASIVAGGSGKAVEKVNALPLHEALSPEERSRVEFIKIDVEGAEWMVVDGIVDHMPSFPNLQAMIVEISTGDDSKKWSNTWKSLHENGFKAFEIENFYDYHYYLKWRSPVLPKSIECIPAHHTDVLFCRTGWLL